MPPLPFTRQRLRHTAWVTLFAWVFALFSGVANACLIQAAAPGAASFGHSKDDPISRLVAEVAPIGQQADPAHHRGAVESGGHDKDGGKAGCLKFCADGTSALSKVKSPHPDLPGLALVVSAPGWPALPLAPDAHAQRAVRPATVGPPLFLRLLRLTI